MLFPRSANSRLTVALFSLHSSLVAAPREEICFMIGAPFLLLRQPSIAFGPHARSLTHSSKLRVGDELANIFAFADLIVIIATAAAVFVLTIGWQGANGICTTSRTKFG